MSKRRRKSEQLSLHSSVSETEFEVLSSLWTHGPGLDREFDDAPDEALADAAIVTGGSNRDSEADDLEPVDLEVSRTIGRAPASRWPAAPARSRGWRLRS